MRLRATFMWTFKKNHKHLLERVRSSRGAVPQISAGARFAIAIPRLRCAKRGVSEGARAQHHKCKLIKFHTGVFAELSNITTVHRTPSDGESIVVFVALCSCCIHWKRQRWHSVPSDSHRHLRFTCQSGEKRHSIGPKYRDRYVKVSDLVFFSPECTVQLAKSPIHSAFWET